jgi:hypothetical protein
MKTKTYEVTATYAGRMSIEVTAKTRKEAEKIAREKWNEGGDFEPAQIMTYPSEKDIKFRAERVRE